LAEETLVSLRNVLPDYATPANPLDLTGGAMLKPELIAQSIEAISKDPGIGLIGYVFDVPGKEDARGFAARFMKEIGAGVAASALPTVLLSNAFMPVNGFSRALADDNGIAYSGGGLRHVLTAMGHLLRWSGALADRTEPAAVAHVDAFRWCQGRW
jgi:acyl-CoA synthetase (NDP forming)